jgi:hypothetical protein
MDAATFTSELLQALTDVNLFDQVALRTEGPVADGRAFLQKEPETFLRFYFNGQTGTLAFALVSNEQRIWGIDFDNRRGWHLHPIENPIAHVTIEPLSVREIVTRLHDVLPNRQS